MIVLLLLPLALCGGDVVLTSAWQSVLCGAQMFRVSWVSTCVCARAQECVFVSLGAVLSLIHGQGQALGPWALNLSHTHTHRALKPSLRHTTLYRQWSHSPSCASLRVSPPCVLLHTKQITPLITNSHPEIKKSFFFFLLYQLMIGKLRKISSRKNVFNLLYLCMCKFIYMCLCVCVYFIGKSIGTPPSNERIDCFSNYFHE